jgi:hypothetical protein
MVFLYTRNETSYVTSSNLLSSENIGQKYGKEKRREEITIESNSKV